MKLTVNNHALIQPTSAGQHLFWMLLVCLLTFAAEPTTAATRIWTGAHATSGDWSRANNWDTAAPVNGDTVVFPAGAARLNNNNDIAGLQLVAIRFIGAGGGYTLSGNAVALSERIGAENTAGANTINLARITLGADARFAVTDAAASLAMSSEVRLGGFELTCNAVGDLTLTGVISGNGNVTKEGAGTLSLAGNNDNTYNGRTRVNAGTLELDKGTIGGIAVPGQLIIGDGVGGLEADVAINRGNNQVSQVTVNSSGLWNIGNFENEVSELTLNEGGNVDTGPSGKLRLGTGAGIIVNPAADSTPNVSVITGSLELSGGTHIFTVGDNAQATVNGNELVITAVISSTGIGGITKEGAGDLTLSGNNTFSGQVIVNAGELVVNNPFALGATGPIGTTTVNNDASLRVTMNVGAELLRLNSTGSDVPALRGVGDCSWAGDITLLRDTRIGVVPDAVLSDGRLVLRGTISGAGGLLKEDSGTLVLAGNAADNTYTGTTYVNAGTLELDKGTIGGVVAVPGLLVIGDEVGGEHADVVRHLKDNQVSRVTINGSGYWDLGTFQDEVSELTLHNGGDVRTASPGRLRLGIGADVAVTDTDGESVSDSSISGNLELLLGQHEITVESTKALTIYATISGVGGITKNGSEFLVLRQSNSFFGPVIIDEGILQLNDAQALGSPLQGTRVNNDATLTLSTALSPLNFVDEPLTLDSTGGFLNNALLCGESGSWSGPISLLRPSGIQVGAGETFDLKGVISGAGGLTKFGTGTLILSGNNPNSYTGVTTVNEGRLQLNKALQNVAVPGRLIIGDDVGGANADIVECLSVNEIGDTTTVTVNGSGQWIARQELIGALAGSGNITISSSLNIGNVGTTTVFHGIISGAGSVNKIGTGTLTFNGNNTYTGGTGVGGGTLLINGQQPSGIVFIQPDGRLGGSGRVGNISMSSGAEMAPGSSPGRLTTGNLLSAVGTTLLMELDGPVSGTQHDQVKVLGTVNLDGIKLVATLNFIPTLGQPLVIIDNDGTDAVSGQFNDLSEGDTLRVNQIPFVISYEGGDGNDVTLTATNRSLSLVSTRVEAGNGNGVIDPNECDHLFIALMNETGNPLTVSHVVLDSLTPGVAVTQQRSDYANFGALDIRTNRAPFQIRTAPDFVCGQLIELALTVTLTGGGSGTFTIPFTVPSGGAGAPVLFNDGANQALVDQGQLVTTLNVSGAAPYVGKVTVALHITHPSAGDLVLRLRSPSGTIVKLTENLGGTTDNYGSGCGNQANRTTFDDAAPVRIAAGTAPFIGSFTPEESLSAFLGENPNGDWQLLIADTVAGDTGELRCWSLSISPPSCTDGGGQCESCVPTFTGRFNADMPSTTTRLVRNNITSGCGSAKVCPAVTTGPRLFYRTHLVTNTGPATCVSVVLADLCRASNLRLHAAAYLGSYNPADPCANYLGDTGGELSTGSTSFSFAAPENAVVAIVVSSPVTTTTCPVSYGLQLHGLPCPPPTLHISKTANPDEVRLHWSTAYPGFGLQRTPNLNGTAPFPFADVPFTPFVVAGDYSVTNRTTAPQSYYRLRKP